MYGVLIALAALLGTGLQFLLAMQQLVKHDRDAASTFRAVDDWRREIPWYRPLRWMAHRREIRRVLAASPAEAALYKQVSRALVSWFLLVLASTGAVVQQLTGL